MLILGVSGRKQSGKSTTGNFIFSLYMSELEIAEKVYINQLGQIMVSDLFGDTNYSGIFDPTNSLSTDYMIKRVFDKLSSKVKLYSFADVLKKDICMNILGLTYEQCYGSDMDKNTETHIIWEDKNLTAREVMQVVGTDIFRNMYNNVWVDATIKKIKQERPELAIITDCRFPNEVDSIKENGGKVIRLTRNPHNSDHISEKILDMENYNWNNFDYILDNNDMELFEQLSKTQEMLETINIIGS